MNKVTLNEVIKMSLLKDCIYFRCGLVILEIIENLLLKDIMNYHLLNNQNLVMLNGIIFNF